MVLRFERLSARIASVAIATAYILSVAFAGVVAVYGAYRVALAVAQVGPQAGTARAARVAALPARVQSVLREATMTPTQDRLQGRWTSPYGAAPERRMRLAGASFGSSSRNVSVFSRTWGDDDDDSPAAGGAYRTVCVRLCDGYYFPISFSTSRERFAQDAKTCESKCGSEARLYITRSPNGDAEDMEDLKGRPYRQLGTAFLYRTQYVSDCKCQPHPWEAESKERHRIYALIAAKQKGNKEAARELLEIRAKEAAVAALSAPRGRIREARGADRPEVAGTRAGRRVTILDSDGEPVMRLGADGAPRGRRDYEYGQERRSYGRGGDGRRSTRRDWDW